MDNLRPKDFFARFGGEEFVIILPNTNSANGAAIAESIRVTVEAHTFVFAGKRIPVTTSIGVTELDSGVSSPDTLMKHADKALYSAKNAGRNRVVVSS